LRIQPTMIQCSVFKAAVLKEQRGFDLNYEVVEDTELFCRLGITRPICAVSGIGCVHTSDDQVLNRLTGRVSEETEPYWKCKAMVCRSVLKRFPSLQPSYRHLVRSNLAGFHLGWAKMMWRSGRFFEAIWHLLVTAPVDPPLGLWIIRNGYSMGYEEPVRPAALRRLPEPSDLA